MFLDNLLESFAETIGVGEDQQFLNWLHVIFSD